MKKQFGFFSICILSFVAVSMISISSSSCKKTETVYVQQDSMKIVKDLLVGKWFLQNIERTLYSGNSSTGSQIEYLGGSNTYSEFKADQTYTSIYKGTPAGGGIWELVSPYYLVLDKGNATQERYYYLLGIDRSVQITHGPFKKDGNKFYPGELGTYYYSK